MFQALTQYPSLQRLLELRIPTLVVLGDARPAPARPAPRQGSREPDENHVLLVVLEGAAHAINFSHPDELAHVIRLFMDDRPIVERSRDRPGARVFEIHRGKHHPIATRELAGRSQAPTNRSGSTTFAGRAAEERRDLLRACSPRCRSPSR